MASDLVGISRKRKLKDDPFSLYRVPSHFLEKVSERISGEVSEQVMNLFEKLTPEAEVLTRIQD